MSFWKDTWSSKRRDIAFGSFVFWVLLVFSKDQKYPKRLCVILLMYRTVVVHLCVLCTLYAAVSAAPVPYQEAAMGSGNAVANLRGDAGVSLHGYDGKRLGQVHVYLGLKSHSQSCVTCLVKGSLRFRLWRPRNRMTAPARVPTMMAHLTRRRLSTGG